MPRKGPHYRFPYMYMTTKSPKMALTEGVPKGVPEESSLKVPLHVTWAVFWPARVAHLSKPGTEMSSQMPKSSGRLGLCAC